MIRQLSCIAAALLASFVAAIGSASAHPHVRVTMRSELVYAPDGTVTGIRHAWTFDDMFSAFAAQGVDSKKRGVFTREELERCPAARRDVCNTVCDPCLDHSGDRIPAAHDRGRP